MKTEIPDGYYQIAVGQTIKEDDRYLYHWVDKAGRSNLLNDAIDLHWWGEPVDAAWNGIVIRKKYFAELTARLPIAEIRKESNRILTNKK
jgi:hypothetical protein